MTPRSQTTRSGQLVDPSTFGAWLLKCRPGSDSMDDWRRTGLCGPSTRCVQRSYRLDLVAEGQPVLLWISGRHIDLPAGIHARGHTTSGVRLDDPDDDRPVMPVELTPVTPAVLRRELLMQPEVSGMEVLRMPAGSNPSFVTRPQLESLESIWPQIGAAVQG